MIKRFDPREGHCHVVGSKNSCGLARVVFQEPPEPFTALDRACTLCVWADRRKEEYIALALMVPLVMKMLDILRQRTTERRFPKEDEPREALLLDGSHPALRIGVEIRRPRRQGYPLDPGSVNDVLKGSYTSSVRINTTGSPVDCLRVEKIYKRGLSWPPSGPLNRSDALKAGRAGARRRLWPPPVAVSLHHGVLTLLLAAATAARGTSRPRAVSRHGR